jgi:hypothetical protein
VSANRYRQWAADTDWTSWPLGDFDLAGRPVALCGRHILIGNSIRLSLDRSEAWRSPPWPICPSPSRLIETCSALARRAASMRRKKALRATSVALVKRRRISRRWRASPARASRLRTLVVRRACSGRPSEDAIQGLLGLGPGLTPSGDDFLVGALALLDCVGERDAHAALGRAIIAALPGATSALSACFLRAAAAGHVGEALHSAVSSIISGDLARPSRPSTPSVTVPDGT